MIKHFCDACGGEMDEYNWAERWSPSLQMNGEQFKVVPTRVRRRNGDDAELCRACMVKLVVEGKVE